MAYNEKINDRIREAISHLKRVEEKHMFGGTCFMLNGKMCVGVVKDEMMCRINPDIYEEALEKQGCREMVFTGKPIKCYVFVSEEGMKKKSQVDYCNTPSKSYLKNSLNRINISTIFASLLKKGISIN